jgi:toxin ParE1/3/4
MKPRVFKTHLAEKDLENIWLYIAQDSLDAADQWLDQLEKKARLLAGQPYIGRSRPELMADVRSFPVRAYILYYRPVEGGIELIRAVHGARDVADLAGLREQES